jgi:two-component sensor histidine kinase
VPLLAFSGFILARYVLNERDRLATTASELARHVALIVDAELTGYVSLLRGLSTSSALRNEDLRQFHEEALQLVAGRDRLVVLRNFGTKQFLNTQLPFDAELPPAVTISETDALAMRNGRAVVSPLYNSPISGEPRVALAIAVTTSRGTHYVLAITVPTTVLRDVLPKAPEGWVLGVGDPQSRKFVTRSLRHEEVSGKPATAAYFEKASDRGGGSFEATNLDGVKVLAGYAYGAFSGWLFAANVPQPVVEAPLRQSFYVISALGATALALSLLLAWVFGRLFTRACTQLVEAARSVGNGGSPSLALSAIAEFNRIKGALILSDGELKERERQRQRLVAELNHRVKNMLAVVQSLLTQTLRHAGTLEEARRSFSQRLRALAAAHDILTVASWGAPELHELLARVTAPYNMKDQFRFSGPKVRLAPPTAISLALAVNELATNAAKYGALSIDGGNIKISWLLDERAPLSVLQLRWQEQGGPVATRPARTGFGTRLLHDSFSGRATVVYLPEGVQWTIEIPLDVNKAATPTNH